MTPLCGQWDDDHIHRLPVRVYYEDTDFSGIVYHARYLHFFERGRTESLRALGVHHSELIESEDPVAFAVRHMDIHWLKPARVDEALTVETLYRPHKGPRLNMEQAIRRGEDTLCTATVEAVIIDPAGRPRRPPKWMIEVWTPVVQEKPS
ncbi:tol-pal system-associated acyl-CoA thioesterase [Hyphobacterium sp. HN65]|uniref:Tol-pal system-associated acyl-CoA thioesterase n=1 Tax=Hyphobacterium lacteum TaxID=3116575 RepID=A0ABU7LPR8_9PROT|nr:tol-pal system-associated acyl-CoA thioesterase [Hyphobacterium sp. HN65]MEE2525906.1 tol-pal system-associated acyl-CoA thioesterase [Hyphobacterium sp. HN65]